jgi:DNA-binding CsgD family transcriptional regulator
MIFVGIASCRGSVPSHFFLFLPRLEEPEIPKVIEHTVERAALKKSVNHFSCGCALFSCLSEVCEIANQGIVVADNAGRIRLATEKAVRWLGEYFGEPHSPALPHQVKDWLQERNSKPFNCERLAGGAREISIQRGPKRLTIQSLSPLPAKEHRLVLAESTDSLDSTPLESLGLTKREAEVLLWAGQAKRNAEIGQILAMGERTVRTHMGRILAKLGVENRTAAANMAVELLRRSAPPIDVKPPMYANGRE